jgi:uncharacterized iron-regulated protein
MRAVFISIGLLCVTTTGAVAGPGVADSCGGELVAVSASATTPATTAALIAAVGTNGTLLIGERHGVREHPKAAACLIAELATKAAPAVVLEMLTPDQAPTVDAYRAAHPEIVDGLGAQLLWWKTGWPAWPVYAPLLDTVWHTRSALLPGDLAKAAVQKTPAELEATFGAKLAAARTSWGEAMTVAHCGLIDAPKVAALADRQINRDLAMAEAITAASGKGRAVVLYAGRAHIRRDRSVGLILANGPKPFAPVIAVSLQETAVAGVPVDRQAVLAEAKGRADYVWFTGVAEKADACERLRAKGLIPTAGVRAREGAK